MRISDWSSDVCSSDPRAPIHEDLDVAILGAGFSGIMAGVHLRNAGVSTFRHIDHAGDFGGVWYWNRYPGIQCDNDACCYMPLLEEIGYVPTRKFADGYDIQAHCRRIATQRSEEHTSELQSLMRISYAVFCLKKQK